MTSLPFWRRMYRLLSPVQAGLFSLSSKKSRRPKVRLALYTTLGLLVLLLPVVYLTLIQPPRAKAATLSLSTTATTVQVDVANRYRAILQTGDVSDDYLIFYDRAEDNTTPNNTAEFPVGPYVVDEGTYYRLSEDATRKTTLIEVTPSRVRVRVEGCLDTTSGGSCYTAPTTIHVTQDITFVPEGAFFSVKVDFGATGIVLDGTGGADQFFPFDWLQFNSTDDSTAFSETIVWGDGQSETTFGTDGTISSTLDTYLIAQATGNYQDIFFAPMMRNGDKVLTNSTDGGSWLEIDSPGEVDKFAVFDNYSQTLKNQGIAQAVVFFKPQTELDTKTEREAIFNDLTNPEFPTYSKGSEWADGPGTTGLQFDGTDDVLNMGSASTLDNLGNGTNGTGMTAEAWIYPFSRGENNGGRIFDKANATTPTDGWIFNLSASITNAINFSVDISTTNVQRISTANSVGLNQWQHVAVTWDGSNTAANVHMYINGQEVSYSTTQNGSGSRDTDAAEDLKVGNDKSGARTFDGYIDEARVWNRQLTQDEIQDNLFRQIPADSSGLIGYWRLNEQTGSTAYDETSNNLDSTITGALWSTGYVPDHFNEGEGIYPITLGLGGQLQVDLDGGPNISTLSNGANSAAIGSFTVTSTSSFPSAGTAFAAGDKFSYTTTIATQFQGVATSGDLALIGHADNSIVASMNRYKPFLKLRNWLDSAPPAKVWLENRLLTNNTDYQIAQKPISQAYWAQDLTYATTLESSNAVTSPDVGSSTATETGVSYVRGRYGQGAEFNSDSDRIAVTVTNGTDLSENKGTVEFWFQPSWNDDDNAQHDLFGISSSGGDINNIIKVYKAGSNILYFSYVQGGTQANYQIAASDFAWNSGDWVHIRAEWDDSEVTTTQQRLYINGVQPPTHSDSATNISGASMTNPTVLFIGNSGNTNVECNCVMDEFKVYNSDNAHTTWADGGDTADTDEYLNDAADDATFSFSAVNTGRGEYLFLGSDSPFLGLNTELATNGAGSSPTITWQYWDGAAWSNLTIREKQSGASSFTADGAFSWAKPANWFPYSVNNSTELYWVRGFLASGSYTTSPVEDTVKTDILTFQLLSDIATQDQTLSFETQTGNEDSDSGGGPVAQWRMDEGYGTTTNDSAGDNHLTTSGATWVRSSDQTASARSTYLQFDGSNDYATRSYDGDFDFGTDSFSISGWFRHAASQSGTDVLLANYNDAGYKLYMDNSGYICFGIDDDTTWGPDDDACSGAATGSLADSKWHHVEAVKNGITSITLYLDGKVVDTQTSLNATGSLNTNDPLYLGIDSDGTSNPWTGFLDEWRVYHYARSAAQVKTDLLASGQTAVVLGSQSRDTLTDGLVGWWKMDETTTPAVDSAGNGLSGTWTGNATSGIGKFGTGISVDGTGDYVDVTDNSVLDFTSSQDFSISAWIKQSGSATRDTIFAKRNGTANTDEGYLLRIDNHAGGNLYFEVSDDIADGNDEYSITGSTDLANSTWYHVVAVWDDDNRSNTTIYVNGVNDKASETGTLSSIGDLSTALNFRVGAESDAGEEFIGTIDEVRVYNRVLSPAEVHSLYTWAPGPVGYWPLDENTGTSAFDKSGTNNTLTLTNSPSWSDGNIGAAVSTAGSNQHLIRADDSDFDFADDSDMTLETWFKHGTASAQEVLLSKYNEAGYKIIMESDGDITCALDYDSTWTPTDSITSTAATYDDGNWHHVACVKSGASSLSLFIDGVHNGADTSLSATNTLTNSDPLYIGINADGTSNDFVGSFDDIKIYNYARTPAQILEDMLGSPKLVSGGGNGGSAGYWKFNEASGTTANDSSPNGNNLTLSSASWTTDGKLGAAWNGTNAVWLSRADDADFDFTATQDFALSGWFRSDASANPGAIEYLVNKANATTAGYALYLNTSGQVCFGIDDDTTWGPDVSSCSSADVYDATWHQITAVRNVTADQTQLSVDGKLVDRDTDSTSASLENALSLYVGDRDGTDNGDEFTGDLDELKIYRAALTPDQIKTEYNQGKAVILGNKSTNSGNTAPDNSQARGFCVPGDTTSCSAPVGWWKLDENTGTSTADSSGNNQNGTLTLMSTSDWSPGMFGSSLNFDGTDGYVSVADSSTLDFPDGQNFTITFWFNRQSFTTDDAAVAKKTTQTSSDAGYLVYINDSTDVLRLTTSDGDGANLFRLDGTTAFTSTGWHHAAVVYNDSSSTASKIYINGIDENASPTVTGSFSGIGNLSNSQVLAIGSDSDNLSEPFSGMIDEVRVYNYARTPAQVAWDFNKGAPIGWWKFNECSGTTVYDSAQNGNGDSRGDHGIWSGSGGGNTSAGTCTSGTSTEAWYNGASGKRGASLDFDGTDDVVTVTNADPLDFDVGLKNGMSYAFWVYANSDGEADTGEIFDKGTNTYCRTDTQGTTDLDLECQIDLATADANLNIANGLTTNTWSQVVVTYSDDGDDELTIFINGVNRGSSTAGNGGPATTDTNNLLLGGDSTHNFDGQIDEFRIYNYELTAQQVKTLYSHGVVNFGN